MCMCVCVHGVCAYMCEHVCAHVCVHVVFIVDQNVFIVCRVGGDCVKRLL